MAKNSVIRIGIVGAGSNTCGRHIPGFQAIDGVEIISVANRTRASAQRVADAFGIPKVYDRWTDLVQASDTDAICIGTWPYMHCPVTLNALECNKHVLCEARMAMNAREARTMLDAARSRPDLVTQIVPSPMTLDFDATICQRIADGYLGDLLAVEIRDTTRAFIDRGSPLTWRQDVQFSGENSLALGIYYEAMMRWVGPAVRVTALTRVNVPYRKDASGQIQAVAIPDHIEVLCELVSGAIARLHFSAVTGLGPASGAWLFGSEGTLYLDLSERKLYGGRRGDTELQQLVLSPELRSTWRVEEEFIGAIRGEERVKRTRFEDGLRYMEFTEAVARSARSGRSIAIGL
jgi:predicted dehydrogenase